MIDSLAIVLVFGYAGTLILYGTQLLNLFLSYNKKISLRSGILYCLSLSCLVASPLRWDKEAKLLLYTLPVWMQVAGLSQLVVHYYEVLQSKVSHAPIALCAVANLIFLVVTITLSILTEHPSTSSKVKHTVEYLYVAFAAFLNLLISTLLGYFGGNLHFHLVRSDAPGNKRDLLPHLKSPTSFLLMNWTLVVMYAVRGVLTLVVGLGLTHLPSDGQMTYEGGHGRTPLFPFTYYVLAEILPCIIVVVMLWQPVISSAKRDSSSDSQLQTNAAVDAKFEHLFDNRGSTVSRDGDSNVKVLFSPEVLSQLHRHRQEEWDRHQMHSSDVSALSSTAASSPQHHPSPAHHLAGTSPYSEQYGNFVYFGSPGFGSSSPNHLTNPLLMHGYSQSGTQMAESNSSSGTFPRGFYAPTAYPHTSPRPSLSSPRPPTGVAMLPGASCEFASTTTAPSALSGWLEDGTPVGSPPSAVPPRPSGQSQRLSAYDIATPVLVRASTGPKSGILSEQAGERAEQARLYAAELSPAYILRGSRRSSPKPRADSAG